MLEYAYHTSKGVNGAKVIKLILEKNPTFSARLLLTPAAGDLIVASDIFSYHTVGEDGYPVGGIQIADLTAEEKGKLILILALRYPSKVYGYGQTGHYTSDASSLVKKLLQVGPPVEAKYINTALYYLRNPVPRKILTMPGYYKMEPERFIDILTDDGHAVNIANANVNQELLGATATNQANYVTKKGAFAAKEAAKAARAAARAARLESWRTNIGAHIKDVLKDNIFEVELIAYLISPEAAAVGPSGKSKLNEKVYTVIGIDVPVTILEYAILMIKNTIVDALLTLPDLLTKIDKDTDIMVHAQRIGMLRYIGAYGFKKYTESALFTVAGMTLDDLYTLLEDAVRRALSTLVFNIFANRGVNPVNPDGDDAPPDPTKLDIYHVYFETFAFPPENRYVTLYRRAELIGQADYAGHKWAAINFIREIIAGYNGHITAKEQRAIFKRKLVNRAVALAEFNKPPEGPFRDGEPATEAAAFATAKEDNTKWPGFSKSDEKISLYRIFLQDFQTAPTPQAPEGTTVRPSLDVTFCPLCNYFADRSMGCLYMSHTCNPEDILDIDLYNKYKTTLTDPAGQISYKTFWCTICNRIANHHGHYKIANIFGPKPDANEQQTGFEVFQNDCGHLG
jgi:hypothetical protein